MPYDLRNFIAVLKKAGELIEVDREVDWNYEISAFEVMSARIGGPAFLFNNIKGIPEGRVRVRRTCFETLFPEELQKWVADNWQRLGFQEEVRWNKPWMEAEL